MGTYLRMYDRPHDHRPLIVKPAKLRAESNAHHHGRA